MSELTLACDRIEKLTQEQEIQDREMLDLSQQLTQKEEEILVIPLHNYFFVFRFSQKFVEKLF